MKFLKAAIMLGSMYPPAFFAKAGGAGGAGAGAAGDVIREEGQQVTSSTSVSIDSNHVNKSQTFIPSDILVL